MSTKSERIILKLSQDYLSEKKQLFKSTEDLIKIILSDSEAYQRKDFYLQKFNKIKKGSVK